VAGTAPGFGQFRRAASNNDKEKTMLPLIVLVAVIAVAWRFSYWPFGQSYKYLPSYGQFCQNKAAHAKVQAPVAPPVRPSP
jgi:hypothetical protein